MDRSELRVFLTSVQKSGTHQIMPALNIAQDIVDRSGNGLSKVPADIYGTHRLNPDGIRETVGYLSEFSGRQFGHITYLPEYAQALRSKPTKVLFNFRDPRDVVIAEYYSVGRNGWPNLYIKQHEKCVSDVADPITELIKIDSYRWPQWIGWLDEDFVLPVKYEDLRLNGRETMEKILEWIYPHCEGELDLCVKRLQPKPKNPTFRRGVPGEWKTGMTDEQKKLAERLLGDVIERLGYEI